MLLSMTESSVTSPLPPLNCQELAIYTGNLWQCSVPQPCEIVEFKWLYNQISLRNLSVAIFHGLQPSKCSVIYNQIEFFTRRWSRAIQCPFDCQERFLSCGVVSFSEQKLLTSVKNWSFCPWSLLQEHISQNHSLGVNLDENPLTKIWTLQDWKGTNKSFGW